MKTQTVGVVVPVHDEQHYLPAALAALGTSMQQVPHDVAVHVVVVLDACSDGSHLIAHRWRHLVGSRRATVITINQSNVGRARAAGCNTLLRRHPGPEGSLWLATTDADSQVPPRWLSRQVALHEDGVSLWNGTVTVVDWSDRPSSLAEDFDRFYAADEAPIHGASLGINARLYRRAGGFQALATGEDRALHAAALAIGGRVYCDRSVPVVTSARRTGRAPHGFAGALTSIEGLPLRADIQDPDPPRAVLSR